MASIGPMTIMTRINEPGAPPVLLVGQLAYNQQNIGTPTIPGDFLYCGDGQNVNVLVGRTRQVELWGDQTITGIKTIDVADLKITGGQVNWLLTTDGAGNISWTNAPGGGLTEVATTGPTLAGVGTTASPLEVVAETVAVAVDGATLTGDGTALHPLAVNTASVTVRTDGVTIIGTGTTAGTPLSVVADSVAVAANAPLSGNGTTASPLGLALVTTATLTGAGTTASPLGVVGATVAVATDGLTVTGNGTAAFPLQATSGTLAVAVDGTTIGGEGITGNPLRALPNSIPVAVTAPLSGNGTTASPLSLATPLALQYGGTGVSASSAATLLTALGAASVASLAAYLQLQGGTMTGPLVLAANASANLQAVPLQQLTSAIGAAPYLPLAGGTLTGGLSGTTISLSGTGAVLTLTTGSASIGGGLTVSGATALNGNTTLGGTATLTLSGNAAANLQAVPLQQLNSALGLYLPLAGGNMTAVSSTINWGLNNTQISGQGLSLPNGSAAQPSINWPAGNGLFLNPSGATLSVSGNFATGGSIQVGTSLNVLTTANFTGAVTMSSTLNVNSNISTNLGFVGATISLTGNASIGGAANISGQVNMFAGLNVAGQVLVGSAEPSSRWLVFGNASGPAWAWVWNAGSGRISWVGASGQELMGIDGSGNMGITGSLTQGSDEAAKNTIASYVPGVSIASKFLPKTFVYNADASNTQRLGFIAQDIEPILPDAVSAIPGVDSASSTLGLDLTAVVAVLANAMKQMIARVQALESAANITPSAANIA